MASIAVSTLGEDALDAADRGLRRAAGRGVCLLGSSTLVAAGSSGTSSVGGGTAAATATAPAALIGSVNG
ncbi:MAG: hypothetical protein AB7O32_06790 [Vicinamibacterales bacterium]